MEEIRPKKYRVLVVDDSKPILDLLADAFANTDYEVKTVNDPVIAYQMIEDGHYNLVVSDIEMPEINGIELLRKIKKHNGLIQVIIMTSYTTLNNTLNTFMSGAADMVFKPFDPVEIVAAVDGAASKLDRINILMTKAMRVKRSTDVGKC